MTTVDYSLKKTRMKLFVYLRLINSKVIENEDKWGNDQSVEC